MLHEDAAAGSSCCPRSRASPLREAILDDDLAECARAGRALGRLARLLARTPRRPPLVPHTAARELEILARARRRPRAELGDPAARRVRQLARRSVGGVADRDGRAPRPVRGADRARAARRPDRPGRRGPRPGRARRRQPPRAPRPARAPPTSAISAARRAPSSRATRRPGRRSTGRCSTAAARLTLLRLACIHGEARLLDQEKLAEVRSGARGGRRLCAHRAPRATRVVPRAGLLRRSRLRAEPARRPRGARARARDRVPLDVRDYHARAPARAARLLLEARVVRRLAKRFDPDAWLVYGATAKHPDLYGWWQRPRRYVLLAAGLGQAGSRPEPVAPPLPLRAPPLARPSRPRRRLPPEEPRGRFAGQGSRRSGSACCRSRSSRGTTSPTQEDARRALGLPLAAPTILSVSRLTAPKEDGQPVEDGDGARGREALAQTCPTTCSSSSWATGPGASASRRERRSSADREPRPPGRGGSEPRAAARTTRPATSSPSPTCATSRGSPCSRPSRAAARS